MPQTAQHFKAVEPRQAQVENDQVVVLREQHVVGLVSARDAIHRVIGLVQRAGEAVRQHRIVFGYQYPHGRASR